MSILREGSCRLVISDWDMPEMDGLELCRAIRSGDLPGYVYMILLTVHDRTEEKVAGLAAGADDFIAKPFNPAELLAACARASACCRWRRAMSRSSRWRSWPSRAIRRPVRIWSACGVIAACCRSISRAWKIPRRGQRRVHPPDLSNQPLARHRQGGASRTACSSNPAD